MKYIKKIGLIMLGFIIIGSLNFSLALRNANETKGPEYTDNENLTASGDNSLSDGMHVGSTGIGGIINPVEPIETHETALNHTIHLIQIAINRLLGILAAIALVYVLYNGFLIFTSGADDAGVKKGKAGIKTAIIAIAGIGLSWLIISAILWLINNLAPTA